MSTPQRSSPPNEEERRVQLPLNPQRGIGLATLTYTRNGPVGEDRRFYFQDDRIIPAEMVSLEGISSQCSLSDDGESQEEPTEACHCYRDTEIDESSHVFNGDMVDGMKAPRVRKHHMRGGSVKGKSKLVNGDLDRHTFLAFFCQD
ncbi:hypothetical protein OAory_01067510 [Aspergillus oryzae]|uniref:Uncharacterized protein n=1 Tax=Aspergillus oryzae TaxID=5062 RepID=A0A1S9D837_ASPOZ|nr:uncharacterized protein G4B84_008790 [Aspergillus flavus NRRL3357]OOO05235.1 hypothetical protein OAory_01067510 [Aspergillus oryzae]QMW33359.1 hypothetical protein G4B84_008790 [Aspergillus flavus NRRL3357]QMW45396.1 hypothetical protein G4B11_008816 [Aspergillus flavus]